MKKIAKGGNIMNQNKEIVIDININDQEIISSLRDITREINAVITVFNTANSSASILQNSFGLLMSAISALNITTAIMTRDMTATKGVWKSWKVALRNLITTLKSSKAAMVLFGAATEVFTGISMVIDGMRTKLLALHLAYETGTKKMVLYKAAMSAWGVIKGVLTPIINIATIAVGKFNTMLAANPIGAIILAITLLVLAIVGLVKWFNRTSAAAEEMRERNEEAAASIQAVSDQLDANRRSHADNLRSIENSTAVNEQLIDRLKDLNDTEELNDAQRAQKIATIRELNDSIEGLNLVYCEETGLLDENSQLQFEQLHLRNEIADANLVAEATQERLNQAMYEEQELLAKYEAFDREGQLEELAELLETGELRQRDYNEAVAALEENYESLTAELELNREEIGYLEEAWYETLTTMTDLTGQYVTDQRLSWDSLNAHQQSVMNDLKSMITDYTAHATDRMGDLSDEVTVTGREMIDNMIENQRVMATWADNIAILANRGIDEGLLDELRRAGPEGAAEVAAMVAMCDDEFRELNEVYGRGAQVATDTMATQLGEGFEDAVNMASHFVQDTRFTMLDEIANADFESIGKEIPAGAARGIARSVKYIEAMRKLAKAGTDEYTSILDINSPSGVYRGYGENIIQGLCNGLNALQSRPVNIIRTLAQNMTRVYNNVDRDYTTIGRQIMTGLNQGLLNGEGQVMSTAQRIANNISRTMRQALDINSPSRVMREQIGRQIPAGIGAGIEKYADVALDQAYKLGLDLVKLNIPSVESMISLGPSPNMNFATAGGSGATTVNDHYTVNNQGLFDGATINWHGEEDIRRTMEKIAWAVEREKVRMW